MSGTLRLDGVDSRHWSIEDSVVKAKKLGEGREGREGREGEVAKKHVYFFGNGKADGNRTMKDLLGGKGSGLAEMTNAGLPVPPGFTISTEVCSIYYKEKAQDSRRRSIARSTSTSQQAREGGRRDARLDRQSAARLGPLGREVLDARHDGHDPQPRPERRGGRRA